MVAWPSQALEPLQLEQSRLVVLERDNGPRSKTLNCQEAGSLDKGRAFYALRFHATPAYVPFIVPN